MKFTYRNVNLLSCQFNHLLMACKSAYRSFFNIDVGLMSGAGPVTPLLWTLGLRSVTLTCHFLSRWVFVISYFSVSQTLRITIKEMHHISVIARMSVKSSDMAGYCFVLFVCIPVHCWFGKSEKMDSMCTERCVWVRNEWAALSIWGIYGRTHAYWTSDMSAALMIWVPVTPWWTRAYHK